MFQIGTVRSYIQTLRLKRKWELKRNGEISSGMKGPNAAQQNRQAVSARLSSITGKLKAGKRLSAEEMEFLRANSPELYEKAQRIRQERDEYRKRLRRCRDKEEVRRVHAAKSQQLVTETPRAGSSGLNAGDKLQAVTEAGMRAAAIGDEQRGFQQGVTYRELPNRAEKKRPGDSGQGKTGGLRPLRTGTERQDGRIARGGGALRGRGDAEIVVAGAAKGDAPAQTQPSTAADDSARNQPFGKNKRRLAGRA